MGLLHGVWRPEFQWTGLAASLIFISSFICEAAGSVIGKPIVARASPTKMMAIALVFGTAVNLLIDGPATVAGARALPPGAWVLLVYLAVVCTAVGYSVWVLVIRDCPVNVAALTVFAQALFGVVIAAVWLHERLHWDQLFGGLAIVVGLAVGLSRQIKRHPKGETGGGDG